MIDSALTIDLGSVERRGGALSQQLVVGSENRLLLAALRCLAPDSLPEGLFATADAVTSEGVLRSFNPLVLVGPTGVGKSLLVEAAATRRKRVVCVEGIEFGRMMQTAMRQEQLAPWRGEMRHLELLAVENFDRSHLSPAAQTELCATIDAVTESGGLVVVTAAREPGQWQRVSSALRDRLSGGLMVLIRQPGLAARLAIVEAAAAIRGLKLSDAELHDLAAKTDGSPREVLGVVTRHGCRRAMSQSSLSGSESSVVDSTVQLKQLVATAARYFEVSQAALIGPSRRRSLVYARGVAIRVARLATDHSFSEIGRAFGGRDHTTIMHADRRTLDRAGADSATQYAIDELYRIVRSS